MPTGRGESKTPHTHTCGGRNRRHNCPGRAPRPAQLHIATSGRCLDIPWMSIQPHFPSGAALVRARGQHASTHRSRKSERGRLKHTEFSTVSAMVGSGGGRWMKHILHTRPRRHTTRAQIAWMSGEWVCPCCGSSFWGMAHPPGSPQRSPHTPHTQHTREGGREACPSLLFSFSLCSFWGVPLPLFSLPLVALCSGALSLLRLCGGGM